MILLLSLPQTARADVYRWEDESGAVHFTDDLSNIPAAYLDKAMMLNMETPAGREISPSPSPDVSRPSREDDAGATAFEAESLSSQIDQLKARISAKENLVKFVEDRQNLALNPLRNRVVDPGDMELYRKYKEELPEDRGRLKELESRLQFFK